MPTTYRYTINDEVTGEQRFGQSRLDCSLDVVGRLHGSDWLAESFIRTPTLDFGTCSIVSGFNDLLFLTPNVVAFIGEPSFELGVDAKVVGEYGSKSIQIGEGTRC